MKQLTENDKMFFIDFLKKCKDNTIHQRIYDSIKVYEFEHNTTFHKTTQKCGNLKYDFDEFPMQLQNTLFELTQMK